MADITWSDVVAVATELATGVSAAFQTMILEYVNETVQASEFGGESSVTFKLARCYLAAHYGYLQKAGALAATGPVTSKSEGGVSLSYASPESGLTDPLLRTNYGESFLSLVRRSPARAGFLT
jgi:hypothetical protein